MTVSDLLDQVYFDAGEPGSAFRTASRRWLNLVRSFIADEALWSHALDPDIEITTSAATTDGIYSLASGSVGYEFLASGQLYDTTNDVAITFEPRGRIKAMDPDPTTGPPSRWSDAGLDSNGYRQIFLWPIPDSTYTLKFDGYKTLTDLTSAQDTLSVDPFFGPISPWSATFVEGLRYYHDLNNNESTEQVELQRRAFQKAVKRKKAQNRLSLVSPMALESIRYQTTSTTGRFDPAHYNNR